MGCCCWSPPYVKLQSTAISLFIFCLIGKCADIKRYSLTFFQAISLSIANFCLQYTRNDCGYCYYRYGYKEGNNATIPEHAELVAGPLSAGEVEEVKKLAETTGYWTTTPSWTETPSTEWWQTTTRYQYFYCEGGHTGSIYNERQWYECRDSSCEGGLYFMDGLWGTFFSFIASIIAWAGSCKKIPETFTVLYRVQATFVSIV